MGPYLFDASGTYRVRHNTLLLTSTKSSGKPGLRWKKLHVCQIVPWGSRLYLVEPSDKLWFCNSVNLGDEPAGNVLNSGFYLRVGDEVKRVSGLPQVPRSWASYLFQHPVTGSVLAIRGIQVKDQMGVKAASVVTLNIGRRQGLKSGMQFWMDTPRSYVQIMQVKTTQSVAQVDSPSASIKVGASVSSQLPIRRREQVQKIEPHAKSGGAVH